MLIKKYAKSTVIVLNKLKYGHQNILAQTNSYELAHEKSKTPTTFFVIGSATC
jgi:hypothetical protein